MRYRVLLLAVMVGVLVCILAYADIPKVINFQGRLTDATGKFVPDGNYSLTFRIYVDSTGGAVKWSEGQLVSVSKGLFNVTLGSINSIPDSIFNYSNVWLGIQVGADPEMRPLQRLSSLGYAYRGIKADTSSYALNSDELDGLHSSDFTSPASDFGRLNIASDLYEGSSTLTSKYVNVSGPDSVYSTSGTAFKGRASGSSASSMYGIRGYVDNSSSGSVYGGYFETSASGTGFRCGLRGDANGSSINSSVGVYGDASNSSTGSSYGAYGTATNSSSGDIFGGYFTTSSLGTGTHYGVYGNGNANSSSEVYGSYGFSSNSSSGDVYGGLFKTSSTGTGTHYGVYGESNSNYPNYSYGVFGYARNSSNGSVYGGYFEADSAGDFYRYGVFGKGMSSSDYSAYGTSGYALNYSTGYAYGSYGSAGCLNSAGEAKGAYGYGANSSAGRAYGGYFHVESYGTGVHTGIHSHAYGSSDSNTYGCYTSGANSSSGDAYGVYSSSYGSSGDVYGGYFTAESTGTGWHYGIRSEGYGRSSAYSYGVLGYASNSSTGYAYGGYFYTSTQGTGLKRGIYASAPTGEGYAGFFSGDVRITDSLVVLGSKNAAVKVDNGEYRLLYSQESTECWFEDFGKGKLVDGKVIIQIDPLFAQTVNTSVEYHVFLTPQDEPLTLAVANQTAASFEVRGPAGSNIFFSYRVVAKRRGFENFRLNKMRGPTPEEDIAEQMTVQAEFEKSRGRGKMEITRKEEESFQINLKGNDLKKEKSPVEPIKMEEVKIKEE